MSAFQPLALKLQHKSGIIDYYCMCKTNQICMRCEILRIQVLLLDFFGVSFLVAIFPSIRARKCTCCTFKSTFKSQFFCSIFPLSTSLILTCSERTVTQWENFVLAPSSDTHSNLLLRLKRRNAVKRCRVRKRVNLLTNSLRRCQTS